MNLPVTEHSAVLQISTNPNPVLAWIGQRSAFLALIILLNGLTARVFTELGAPGVVKFLHFGLAIVFLMAVLPFIRVKSVQQILFGLLLLLWVIIFSALINGAGILNIFLEFLMLAEPIMLLLLMVAGPMSIPDIRRFQLVILITMFVHAVLCYYQYVIEGYMDEDLVKGLFFQQGAGHHVAGAIGLTTAVYYYFHFPFSSVIFRFFTVFVLSGVAVVTDSKQVVGVFILSLGMLLLLKLQSFKQFAQSVALLVGGVVVFFIVGLTLLPGLLFLGELDRVQEGLGIKFGVFPLVAAYYDSFLNWFFGVGPGHTVGRLAKILPEYIDMLQPFGATISPVTQAVWDLQESSWVSQVYSGEAGGSSMWSPFLSWAGIWGDLGLFGVGVYLSMWILIFRHFCLDDLSRFFVFNVLVFGAVYGWLEEPGYMLMVVALIGLNWQASKFPVKNDSVS